MSRETFGMEASTLYHNLHYNNRLQLVDIRVGDSSTDEWTWNRGALVYYYGTTARDGWNAFANSTDNNGNVLRQVNYVPLSGGGYVIPQLDDYNYDALNRNTSVTEAQQNSSSTWTFNLFTQNFGYDRWGNRTVSCSPCQTGVTGDNFTVDTTTNRLTAKNGIGMTYDSAGNQTYDATGSRWFDGENKMYKAVQSGTTSYYVYDSDGKRVRRIIGATETWMVYGLDGELVAEYAPNGAAGSPQKEYGYRGGQMLIVAQTSPLEIRWTVPDHLGTPRMNIMGNGVSGGLLSSVKRHDYLPFGEELFAGVGLRSGSSHGYEPPSDGVRQKFTDYERDGETGLDFAQARFFASSQGRFTSIDPLMASASTIRPQSWNRYSYSYNNPLRFSDPTGMLAGDYYNENGKKIGTDGVDDGKVYIVTNEATAKKIEKTKGNTPVDSVSSSDYIEAPDLAVRNAIGAAVERSNGKTTDDQQGGFHEEGGQWGLDANGKQAVVPAAAGAVSNPQVDKTATIKTGVPANPADAGRIVNLQGTFHIHPKGEVVIGPGPGVIGGTTKIYNFEQKQSNVDVGNATTNNIVVGARDKTVYFYNSSGPRGTFPLNQFLKLGKK